MYCTLSILMRSTQSATFLPTPISFTSSSRASAVPAALSPERKEKTPSSVPCAERSIAAVFWMKSARYPKPNDRSIGAVDGGARAEGGGKGWRASSASLIVSGGENVTQRFSTIFVMREMLYNVDCIPLTVPISRVHLWPGLDDNENDYVLHIIMNCGDSTRRAIVHIVKPSAFRQMIAVLRWGKRAHNFTDLRLTVRAEQWERSQSRQSSRSNRPLQQS